MPTRSSTIYYSSKNFNSSDFQDYLLTRAQHRGEKNHSKVFAYLQFERCAVGRQQFITSSQQASTLAKKMTFNILTLTDLGNIGDIGQT
jgi:hypothetical protein